MTYKTLGARGPAVGKADQTGKNPGNWTITFTPDILNFTVSEVYVYKATFSGALGSSFDVYIESAKWDSKIFGNQNSWEDNSDTLVLRIGETLYLFYDNPVTDLTPPVATLFLRYNVEKEILYKGVT